MTDCNPVDVGATQSLSKSDENASHLRSSPLCAEVRMDIHPKGEICSVDVEICTVFSILFYLVLRFTIRVPKHGKWQKNSMHRKIMELKMN